MSSRRPPSSDDDFGDDDVTVVDGALLVEEDVPRVEPDYDTPVEPPLCVECGKLVQIDSVLVQPHFPDDQCIRSQDGHWHWCSKLRKSVTYVPP